MLKETHLLAELHHRLTVSSLQFRALVCTSISWLTWTLCLCTVLYSVYNTFPEKTLFGAHNGPQRKAVNYAFSQWTRSEVGYVPAVLLGKGLFGEWSLRDVRQLKHSVNRKSGKSRDYNHSFWYWKALLSLSLQGSEHKSHSGWLESRAPELQKLGSNLATPPGAYFSRSTSHGYHMPQMGTMMTIAPTAQGGGRGTLRGCPSKFLVHSTR